MRHMFAKSKQNECFWLAKKTNGFNLYFLAYVSERFKTIPDSPSASATPYYNDQINVIYYTGVGCWKVG